MQFGTLTREGFPAQLDALTAGLNVYVHLYINDLTPTIDTVSDDMVEVFYLGYSARPLAKWTPAALVGDFAFSAADPVVFEWTEGDIPNPVFGYYATMEIDGPLLWVWRKPGDPLQLGPDSPQLVVAVAIEYPCRS